MNDMNLREFHERPFAQPYRMVIFFSIVGLLLFTRLFDLGWKSMMHDELLFIHYTHDMLYLQWTYQYLPILHGPIMLQFQSLVWHVFGVTDYTARLGASLLGIGGFFFLWKLRYWLSEPGTWFVLLFYALSPGITFFHRFFHQDSMYMFCTLWILSSLMNWWRTKDGRWAASAIIACTALFTNKASALFVYFSIITFVVLLVIHDLSAYFLEGKASRIQNYLQRIPRFPSPFLAALVSGVVITLCLTQTFEGIVYDADVQEKIGHDWVLRDVRSIPMALGWMELNEAQLPNAKGPAADGGFWRLFYAGLFGGLLVAFACCSVFVEKRIGRTELLTDLWRRIHANRWYIVGAIGFSIALYLAIYTSFFKHKIGLFEIYSKTWSYWGGQHEWGRIGGPFHQHGANLVIYEMPAVLIVLGAWIMSLFRTKASRTLGVGFLVMIVAFGGFHALMFGGLEYIPAGGINPVPLEINWLKHLFFGGLLVGLSIIVFPGTARALLPLSMVGLIAYSTYVINTDWWARAMTTPLYKHGEPLILATRHVPLSEYIEISFNFDAGWNILLVMALIFCATILAWQALSRGERFHAFLIWYAVTMFGAASYAREAVPQVGIHPMLAFILLAGSYITRLWPLIPRYRISTVFWFVLGVMVLWNAKTSFNLNFYRADQPRERMAYGPMSQDVVSHMRFIQEFHKIGGLRVNDQKTPHYVFEPNNYKMHKRVRVYMRVMDQVTWPAKWYLRDIYNEQGNDVQRAIGENWEFIFVRVEDLDRYPGLREKYHIRRGRGTTFWMPNSISTESLTNIWKEFIPGHYLDASPQASQAYTAKEDWKRIWRYMLFRETFDGTDRHVPSWSSFEYMFCYHKDLF